MLFHNLPVIIEIKGGTVVNYTFDIRGECLIVRITGDIDHHRASDLRSQTDNAIFKGGIKKVIFDFTSIFYYIFEENASKI